MSRYLFIAVALAATAASAVAAPRVVTAVTRAVQNTLGATLTAEVIKARDAQIAAGADAVAAQGAVEIVVQTVISESGEGTDQAIAAIASTRTSLNCIALDAPADQHPASCPVWTNAALYRVEEQIRAVTTAAPSATGGSSGPASVPPPPSAGAAGGGGGAGYRPTA
jgi:hypothetical protein